MPIFKIIHITKYEYNRPIKESSNEIKVFPFISHEQEVLQHELKITNHPDVFVNTDYWGNKSGSFNLLAPHKELIIESTLTIRTLEPVMPANQIKVGLNDIKKHIGHNIQLIELTDTDCIVAQEKIEAIAQHLITNSNNDISTLVHNCCIYIYTNFKYIKGITTIETTVDEILEHQSGVCQDFAHLMLQILRTVGIPSRYVSGYICPNKNGMRGEGATHAWVEAYIPTYGWAGIDPTNNVWISNNHIKLAVGKSFKDCTPVKGTFKGPAKQKLSVYVSVGYEDGQILEEINNVQMQSAFFGDAEEEAPALDAIIHGQQQQ